MHDAPRREFYAKMDAANVDLKAFTDEFYFKQCGARSRRCSTRSRTSARDRVWFEITTLLIPARTTRRGDRGRVHAGS
jgi:pyruvate formate lyase activating enzyme